VIKVTEANSVADTAAATAVTTETVADEATATAAAGTTDVAEVKFKAADVVTVAGLNVVEVSLTALQPVSLMNEATCKLADSGSTEVNINIDAATGFTEVKVKTATDVVKVIEANSVAGEATATVTATAGTADAAEVKFEATSTDEPLLVNMPPADATDAGAEATPVNFADAAAALGEADVVEAVVEANAEVAAAACVVEADIGEAKLPKFVGVAAEVAAKATAAEAVDAKAAVVEANAEVAAAACVVEADIGEAKLPKFVGVAAEIAAKATAAEAVDAKAAVVEANAEVAADAQAATYAPVTADVVQSSSCATTTATATADAIEANSVAENATVTATAGAADAPEAKLKATSTDEPLLVNTGSGAKDTYAQAEAFSFKAATAPGGNLANAAPEAKFKATSTDEPLLVNTGSGAKATPEVAADAQAATYAQATADADAQAAAEAEVNSDVVAMFVTEFPFGEKPYGTPTTVGGNKAASNLSVIDWQQKRARGLTSPVKPPSQQASAVDETVKVGSSLRGNSSACSPVTARVVTPTQTNSAGQVIFQVEQPSAWSPSLSGGVTVRKILQSNVCSISLDASQELIEADIAQTATSSLSGRFARNVSIQGNKHPSATYAFNMVAKFGDDTLAQTNSAGQVINKVTVAKSAICASTKVISRLSKWEYHFEAITATICKTGLDSYVSTFQVLLLASFLCCTMLTGWSLPITLWQWNKEFKQRSMNGLDFQFWRKATRGITSQHFLTAYKVLC
jgi:hypothetical protein